MNTAEKNQGNAIKEYISDVTQRAYVASREIAAVKSEIKDQALENIAKQILTSKKKLKERNALDLVEIGRAHV